MRRRKKAVKQEKKKIVKMMTKNGMKIAINVVKEAMLYAVKLAAM